jgi:hypothetical protein
MRIAHIQTRIETIFGVVDDDDNVTQTFTVEAKPTSLSDEVWTEQAHLIREKRDELTAQLDGGEPEANGKPANRAARRANR